jgi:NTF2-related export protein 1/2
MRFNPLIANLFPVSLSVILLLKKTLTKDAGSQPPSLMVTVSGTVIHGKGPSGNPAATPAKSIDGQPRVFAQTFMLVPDTTAAPSTAGEVAKYYINTDAMRFVG